MRELFWLSEGQFLRIKPHLPWPHGKKRVDDRRVISGIIDVVKKRSDVERCTI